ncbi:hypothetical protein [Ramlibacter sp.]|uniref:hypothetical protein n=1 Tax=Ramlibacter sp. TaxID=1917967 RepID=UPI003D10A03F
MKTTALRSAKAGSPSRHEAVLRSLMSCQAHSAANRRLARDIVWRWLGSRWPHLRPNAALMERDELESASGRSSLRVATSEDGAVWTLTVSSREREADPEWTTRAVVADGGAADLVAVETSCSDLSAAWVISPPAVLGQWVDRLRLEDAGVPVTGQPRHVTDEAQARALFDHVTGDGRRLAVVLLAAKGDSQYYGVDPRMVAQSVRGLAHVACLTAPALGEWSKLCGRAASPVTGTARIYVPGYGARSTGNDVAPPSFSVLPRPDLATEGKSQATELRHRLSRQLCALTVATCD